MSIADDVEKLNLFPSRTSNEVVLWGIDWQTYVRLRDETDRAGSHALMVFNDGALVIEMPNKLHEVIRLFVGSMLENYLLDHDIDFSPLGSTTWRRELERKGLEADGCFYIQNVAIADAREEADLSINPPPDLAIEIEVATPLIPKLPVYADIGVPEVWHVKGWDQVHILLLNPQTREYEPLSESVAVRGMTAAKLHQLIATRRNKSSRDALLACRASWSSDSSAQRQWLISHSSSISPR